MVLIQRFASGIIAGSYGHLEVAADGTYTYVMSREARDGMAQDDNWQENFTYYLTDADGDQVASTLTINLQGVANMPVNVQESTPADDTLVGEDGVVDIFVWNFGDEGDDTVLNFNPTEGDVLDLADLLVGEESGLITNYISISEINDGADTVISLTPTGAGSVTQTITLQGVSFTDLGIDTTSMTTDEAIITHLVESGYINIDQ
ncbi:MAG: type I secretion C-terminal target domain-containing protein [Nitrincola sp.]|nr:type I secretion C-terminal target domain-containing protein [Nitrincola sp.]